MIAELRGGGRRWIPALALGAACAAQAAPNDAASWLQRTLQAARTASYSGTYAHSNGDRTSAVHISHVIMGTEEHERIEPLDGPPIEIVRRNDEMFCYFPDAKTIRLDRRVTAHFFPALLSASSPEAVAASYDVKLGKTESALGFDCQWIRLEPKDGMRYAQSLCAETHSGLTIRAKTFNAQNQVIEQYTFTELKIGPQVAKNDVKSSFESRVKRWITDRQPREEAKNVDTGWTVNEPPPGFRKVTELRRTLPGRAAPVSQLVYTDGVASISVFVEPNAPPRTADASTEDGTTAFFVHPMGDTVVSVLGEVPLATAQQVARSVARRP
jgi:sigma-E factor negative regulatory protein RseB